MNFAAVMNWPHAKRDRRQGGRRDVRRERAALERHLPARRADHVRQAADGGQEFVIAAKGAPEAIAASPISTPRIAPY